MERNISVLKVATSTQGGQSFQLQTRIGGVVQELRTQLGMSIKELAERSGVSHSHLSRLERGLTMPSYRVVSNIARALNTDLGVFTNYTDRSSRADHVIEQVLIEAGIPLQDLEFIYRISLNAREILAELFADRCAEPVE